ncbi:MAG: hypothetical protein AAB501_00710 [Patescibacteria group bacterium]
MATTGESLGKTVELMFDIAIYGAEKTYQKVKSSAPAYLKALAKGVAIWFLIIFASIILKALTGWPWFAYIGVGLCFILGIALAFLGSPLGVVIGMLKGETINPAIAGSSYVRGMLTALFVSILVFLYTIEMPIENNPGAVPKLLICGMALVIGIFLWGSWIPPKLYTLIVMGTMTYTSLSLFDPNPVGFVLNSFNHTYSTYQDKKYSREETIFVYGNDKDFSELITLYGNYNVVFKGWAHFKREGSGEYITAYSSQDFNYPSLKKFRVRSQLGLVVFTPVNNE